MKVQQLNLANFRGFEQIELKFEDDVTLIAGVNGVGKSGILHALATLFSNVLPEITPSKARVQLFSNTDIREEQNSLITSARMSVNRQAVDVSIQRSREDTEVTDNARNRLKSLRALISEEVDDEERLKELKEEERYLKQLLKKKGQQADVHIHGVRTEQSRTGDLFAPELAERAIKNELRERTNQPLALFFSPERQLIKEIRKLPKPTPLRLAAAYQDSLESRPLQLSHFVHWYRVQQKLGVRGGRRQQILYSLQRVITEFIPEFEELRVEEEPTPRFVVLKNGTPLVLNQLSDGERGLLAMLFDITRRLSIANPDLDDPIAEGSAVILIDEIELHLHPLWQRQVLRRFKKIFRNCQFVATTHSPLVIGEVETRCVRFLDRDDQGRVFCNVPNEAYGLDANRVLEELMGTRIRTQEIAQSLEALFELIDIEDFAAARKAIHDLRLKLGENDPELTRASSLIKFLEGGE